MTPLYEGLSQGLKEKVLENLKKAEVMIKKMGMDYWFIKTKKALGRL